MFLIVVHRSLGSDDNYCGPQRKLYHTFIGVFNFVRSEENYVIVIFFKLTFSNNQEQ